MTHYSPHVLHVRSLFRRALRSCFDWSKSHQHFRQTAIHTRYLFEDNRNVTNPKQVAEILAETESFLQAKAHPEPYQYPTSPFGTKYERNAPVPLEVVNNGYTYVCPRTFEVDVEPYFDDYELFKKQ